MAETITYKIKDRVVLKRITGSVIFGGLGTPELGYCRYPHLFGYPILPGSPSELKVSGHYYQNNALSQLCILGAELDFVKYKMAPKF